jgi:hypothetical protein
MSLRTPLVIVLIALSTQVWSQTAPKPKQTFEEALTQARTPLVLHDGSFSGPGAVVLNTAVQQSRFVMLGESHTGDPTVRRRSLRRHAP